MTDKLTDEALMKEAASMLAAEYRANGYDSYAEVSDKQLGAFTLCSIRAIAAALSRRATPADDLRAAAVAKVVGRQMEVAGYYDAAEYMGSEWIMKCIRAALAQKGLPHD